MWCMTRTEWLLVVLIGLVAWVAGLVLKAPVLAAPGLLAVIAGLSGATNAGRKA